MLKEPYIPEPHPNSHIDHASHAKSGFWPFPDRLHVVTAIINSQRYRTRNELYLAFEKRCEDAGAILHTVEVAFGGRHWEVTRPDNPNHLQLRTEHELWHKENALNVLIADVIRRYPSAKYFAWVDADVQFSRADWAQETIQQLQHYHAVQMWSTCQDLDINHEVIGFDDGGEQLPGMMYQWIQAQRYGKLHEYLMSLRKCGIDPYQSKTPANGGKGNGGRYRNHPGHCGYAWAATRHALDTLGGLIDWSPCGANDHHMARALIGNILESVHSKSPQVFKDSLIEWGRRAELLKPKIGYVPGLITHFWHGPKVNRQYISRWQIINDNKFDQNKDLVRDAQGLYRLSGNNKGLIGDLMAYFRQRNEDATT